MRKKLWPLALSISFPASSNHPLIKSPWKQYPSPSCQSRKLDWRRPLPTARDRSPRVIPNREAQARHPLHACGALVSVGRRIRILGDLVGVDTVGEPQDGLQVRAARRERQRRARTDVPVLRPVAVAPPGDHVDLLVDIRLRLGRRVTRHHVQVPWEGNLGAVNVLVVRLERGRVDLRVGVAVDIVQGWRPVHGQIIGVLTRRAALLEVRCRGEGDVDGVGAVERMHVRSVFTWQHDRVDVLTHKGLMLDDREGRGGARQEGDRGSLHDGVYGVQSSSSSSPPV